MKAASAERRPKVAGERPPGWERLVRHSRRLGWRWLASGWRHGWRGARVGLCRLLVPLDPWRYYELGRIADQPFAGLNLDVSSPKLLTSLLHHEGNGEWIGVDLFRREIERWRHVDAALRLEVVDATRLSYPDATFDGAICVSVIEHIAGDGDARAMAELWRVLKPGGLLHLTTVVSREPEEVWREDRIYGEASVEIGGRVFFERHYGPEQLRSRLLTLPWEVVHQEWARETDRSVQDRFYRWAPLSYLWGNRLQRRCPGNFTVAPGPEVLASDREGVVYLVLRKR